MVLEQLRRDREEAGNVFAGGCVDASVVGDQVHTIAALGLDEVDLSTTQLRWSHEVHLCLDARHGDRVAKSRKGIGR